MNIAYIKIKTNIKVHETQNNTFFEASRRRFTPTTAEAAKRAR